MMKRLFLFLVLCAVSVTNYADYEYHIKNEFYDLIYEIKGIELYNQDKVTCTDFFKNASLEEKQEILLRHFYWQRLNAHLESIKEIGISLPWEWVPASILAYKYSDRLARIPSSIGMAAIIGLQQYLQESVFGTIYQGKTLIETIKKVLFRSKVKGGINKYELEYVKNKPWVAKELQDICEVIMVEHNAMQSIPESKAEKFEIINTVLNLPRNVKEIIYNNNHINETLVGYPADTVRELKRYCIRHVAACRADSVRKIAAYFYGVPGVGKTRAIKLIAKALDLPFEIISLGEMTIKDLVGTEDDPGLLLKVLSRAKINGEGAKNMLLGIDDADRVLLNSSEYELSSFILTLLEPETKSFFSPYLNTEVDISHLGIILAGNSNMTDPALGNRLHIIHFNGYGVDYKKSVVWDELFPSLLEVHEKADLILTKDDFTSTDYQTINGLIEKDDDPGFRSIKLQLMKYLEDKVLAKYFGSDDQKVSTLLVPQEGSAMAA